MMRLRSLALIGIAGLGSCGDGEAMVQNGAQTMHALEVGLQVEQHDGALFARLTFTNRSQRPYTMLKWLTFPKGKIDDEDYLEVTVDERPARYIGKLVKRRPAGPADDGTIQPGYAVTSTVNLSEAYELPHGHSVSVTYSAVVPPAGDRPRPERVRSNTVTVRW